MQLVLAVPFMAVSLRPQFERIVALPADDVVARLETSLADPAALCRATRAGRHLWIHLQPERQHTWSPWLDLEIEPVDRGSLLRGRFGPHPSIWSFFAALYAISAFCAVGGLVIGASQLSLGFTAWGLWAVPGAALLAAGTYAVAQLGKRLAAGQMAEVQAFLEAALR